MFIIGFDWCGGGISRQARKNNACGTIKNHPVVGGNKRTDFIAAFVYRAAGLESNRFQRNPGPIFLCRP